MNEPRFEIYPQSRIVADPENPENVLSEGTGEYGWRFRAGNGQISAVGGEGFATTESANRAVHDFVRAVTGPEPHPPIIETAR